MNSLRQNRKQKAPTASLHTGKKQTSRLILINDEVNSFDHVISCLVEICDHDALQAEQCATITHYKGECDVKNGDFHVLFNLHQLLKSKGLRSKIG